MGTLTKYLAKLAMQKGCSIAINAGVDEIIKDSKSKAVKGVRLLDGKELKSNIVISNCTNHVTYNHLFKSHEGFPDDFRKMVNSTKYEGVQVKFNMVLNDMPRFK